MWIEPIWSGKNWESKSQPDKVNGCVVITTAGMFKTVSCTQKKPVLCEQPAGMLV